MKKIRTTTKLGKSNSPNYTASPVSIARETKQERIARKLKAINSVAGIWADKDPALFKR